jgi:predicted amidohydrolase YtcJ
MDRARPRVRAAAIAGNRIVAVGEDAPIRGLLAPGGAAADLGGRTVVPGFTDSHIHFVAYALSLTRLDLSGVRSKAEVLRRTAERARVAKPGEWLLGRGWDRNLWDDPRFPAREELDSAAPHNPVALDSKDGHCLWVNSAALAKAGITTLTPSPAGGEIERRPGTGEPTGILKETAKHLVKKAIGTPSLDSVRSALITATAHAHRAGLTGIHDCEDALSFAAFQELWKNGELGLRTLLHIPAANLEHAIALGLRTGFGNGHLRVGGVKIFADGALGSRTAAMLAPYEDEPLNTGVVVTPMEEMRELVSKACRAGISVAVHAIGDRANRDVLDVLEQSRRGGEGADLRHRIEHAQLLCPNDIPRLAQLGVVASMQPLHATSDMEMARLHWGEERLRGAYAWRSLLDAGAVLAFGSDCPIETLDPFAGIHAAVTRRRADGSPGPEGWRPEECITVEEAVRAYTMGAAHASGEEREKGSIAPGKLADMVVLSHDIFTVAPAAILETTVVATILDGRLVYDGGASDIPEHVEAFRVRRRSSGYHGLIPYVADNPLDSSTNIE